MGRVVCFLVLVSPDSADDQEHVTKDGAFVHCRGLNVHFIF